MISKSQKSKDMAEQILVNLQDAISLIRTMRDPETLSPLESFECALDLVMQSGKRETWQVTVKQIEIKSRKSEVENG